jgi:hypothetical protein
MKVVEIKCRQECNCSASVGMWNYWDLEHVVPLHKGFKDFTALHESSSAVAHLVSLKNPIFPILTVESLVVQLLHDENTLKLFNVMLGMPVLSTIKITEIRKDYSVFEMSYKYIFMGWRKILTPIIEPVLRKLVVFWNNRQWKEDLPVKLRRQKVMRMGFKDFKGLPDKVSDRFYEGPIACPLPVHRLKDSPSNIPEILL